MYKYFIYIFLLLGSVALFGQTYDAKTSRLLTESEKMFIAQKISKIQADHDEIAGLHESWQKDTAQYKDRSILLQLYNETGNNCFKLNPGKAQTYDIETDKIVIDGITDTTYSIYHSYMVDNGKQYFLAIDDSGYIFLLHNYWKDELNMFIKKRYGLVKDINKAFEIVKIFISTKLYSPFERKKVIIDESNIKQYNQKYSYLQPVKLVKNEKGLYEFSLYTVSPYSEEVTFFDFLVPDTGGVSYTKSIKHESMVTD
ncbi:MAG: hypothetical protein HF314_16930 [Ignavibacteria bacterium]|jgi:hypothetical protein|nr:hypothetical protein [Ignavibacteria bacterium]